LFPYPIGAIPYFSPKAFKFDTHQLIKLSDNPLLFLDLLNPTAADCRGINFAVTRSVLLSDFIAKEADK
jgi:hypothetical protein